MVKNCFERAAWAIQLDTAEHMVSLLKQRFFVVVEAVAAVLMRLLKRAHELLFRVSKNPRRYLSKRIILLLATPVFKAHTFCFEVSCFCLKHRMALLNRQSLLLSGDDYRLQFDKPLH